MVSVHWDEKGLLLGENKELKVSYRWEKPVISTQEHLLTRGEMEGDAEDWRTEAS